MKGFAPLEAILRIRVWHLTEIRPLHARWFGSAAFGSSPNKLGPCTACLCNEMREASCGLQRL